MGEGAVTIDAVLGALTVRRIQELGRDAGLTPRGARKADIIRSITATPRLSFRRVLSQLRRDELREACRHTGLDDAGRARQELMQRLLQAHGEYESAPPVPLFTGSAPAREVPSQGDTVVARHRQWLVDQVTLPPEPGDATWVRLTCLDDDNRGQTLELLWELELGARVIRPEAPSFHQPERLDEPRHFAAYLHALRWQSVTAAEQDTFQAPFRAGIQVLGHQLTPLQKALSLPRANLFIADDVGLGKTIEAGLVLQELLLRQRVELALIVCPASVTLQWQREMDQRFGLRFEVYSRDFVLARRRERGFGTSPWDTHNRFIISYPLLRRPEYLEPLLTRLTKLIGEGTRAKKSLLILDEAHTAAPASGQRYAVDSKTTGVVRAVAGLFENRLFLSATPHNGHSNSFSALLEILDPQRFVRGTAVEGREQLAPVMVRRLKRDLRELKGGISFPERRVVQVTLHRGEDRGLEASRWSARFGDDAPQPLDLGSATEADDELELAEALASYTALFEGLPKNRRLPLINLQKRLLSSVEAFHRTLTAHTQPRRRRAFHDDDDVVDAEAGYGLADEELDEREDLRVEAASSKLREDLPVGAAPLIERMFALSQALRGRPCAKTEAFLSWVKAHPKRRVLVFTEYADTLRFLRRQLQAVFGEDAEDLVMQLHGGMGEESRDDVQARFNADPKKDPVRVLLATDAAREGLNLQAHCADLFHFDIPWNPSRMEQRNGRIDRALQPEPEVRCHYFVYDQRPEDRVLQKVVEKTEVIHRELGSLGEVVAARVTQALEGGIDSAAEQQVSLAEVMDDKHDVAARELETVRERQALRDEMDRAYRVFARSEKRLRFKPEHLKDALDVGLTLSGAEPLSAHDDGATYELPSLGREWDDTLAPMRPPRGKDEPYYEWSRRPPRPVVFRAPGVLKDDVVHLHLEHPFVQRVLSRFLAQGFSSHDLSRVTAVPMPDGDFVALAIGRLCLFGAGAGRLYDGLLAVAAELGPGGHATPLDERDSRAQFDRLESELERSRPDLSEIGAPLRRELLRDAPKVTDALLPALRAEADAQAVDLEQKLTARAQEEQRALRQILESQRTAIDKALGGSQLNLDFGPPEKRTKVERQEAEQVARDRSHLERRLERLETELEREPAELAKIYDVKLRRFEPVGLVYLIPRIRL